MYIAKDQLDKETIELLKHAGREKAFDFLKKSIELSKDGQETLKYLFGCRRTAIHILAMEMYNLEKQFGISLEEQSGVLVHDVLEELQWVKEKGVVKQYSTGGENNKPPKLKLVDDDPSKH